MSRISLTFFILCLFSAKAFSQTPGAIPWVTASDGTSGSKIYLNWGAPTTGGPVSSYNVWVGDAIGPLNLVNTVT